jgi:hypothetical protein
LISGIEADHTHDSPKLPPTPGGVFVQSVFA